ncbi:ankyrin repeat domain-containing protein [Streptomyces sp. NPDC052299]|uniref:ankyrin repeat domain-containing protein n=1 Tax=Streptomyces sp. NPDC052299 TaxID=3155054 RepID=UPI003418B316
MSVKRAEKSKYSSFRKGEKLVEMTPARIALEREELGELRRILDAGDDVHQEWNGFTLLHSAVDGEVDAHVQTGEPLHVDATALLLSKGADPDRPSHGGRGVSARHMAFVSGHWLASDLFEAWTRRGK